jgi:hypothetical protein
VAALALAGCVHYCEDWQFARDGSGIVTISCAAKTPAATSGVPDAYAACIAAISQQCVQAGLRLCDADAAPLRGRQRDYRIRIWFPSLRAAAQCPLFSGRVLQWSAQRNRARVLHVMREWPACIAGVAPGIELLQQQPAPVFEWRMQFPGRVISATGCNARGRRTQLLVPGERIAATPQIAMLVVAHTRITWWEWLLWCGAGLALLAAVAVLVCVLLRVVRRPPAPPPAPITYI